MILVFSPPSQGGARGGSENCTTPNPSSKRRGNFS